jgi:hypothetical protein
VVNLQKFIPAMLEAFYPGPTAEHKSWLNWCKERQSMYPVLQKDYWKNEKVFTTLFPALMQSAVGICSIQGNVSDN